MPYSLKNIFDLDTLRELFATLQSSTGISCSLMDQAGELVVASLVPTLCERFCEHHTTATHVCTECRKAFVRAADAKLRHSKVRCYYGLHQVFAPLIIEDEYLGALLLGQILIIERKIILPLLEN